MFTNNDWDKNLWIEAPLTLLGAPPPTQPLLKKVKFFIYCAILIKFETQYFHMFTKNNWDRNLWIEAPLPPEGPSLSPHQKSQILHLLEDFDEI